MKMRTMMLALAAGFAMTSMALAADVAQAQSLPVKAPTVTPAGCTPSQCSGPYIGAALAGEGTNGDILGSGLSQSVFANGAAIDIHVGYQVWNGNYLFAIEGGVGNQFNNGALNGLGSKTIIGYEGIKFGGSLAGIINPPTGSTVAGQTSSPTAVFSSLANSLMAPYGWMSELQRGGYNQTSFGGGVEYALAQSWNLDARYEYAPTIGNLNAYQAVKVGLNYHFNLK